VIELPISHTPISRHIEALAPATMKLSGLPLSAFSLSNGWLHKNCGKNIGQLISWEQHLSSELDISMANAFPTAGQDNSSQLMSVEPTCKNTPLWTSG
jgi:hypothetical protein